MNAHTLCTGWEVPAYFAVHGENEMSTLAREYQKVTNNVGVVDLSYKGKIEVRGWKWKISKSLCGEWVHLVAIDDRVLVYYCATLFREIDLRLQCSTIVEHWSESPHHGVKDV